MALRYVNNPTQDCGHRKPGQRCSIANIRDYREGLDVHFSSGVFNKAFYLIASAPDWNIKKAFDIMVEANLHQWTPATSFNDAACGVLRAAQTYAYDISTVQQGFAGVGIDTQNC